MEIKKSRNNDELYIYVSGRIDSSNSYELSDCINEDPGSIKKLIIDLENLEYLSSAGLRILLAAQKMMNMQGEFLVKNINDTVYEIFCTTGFSDVINIERKNNFSVTKVNITFDYLLERKLFELDPKLHERFKNSVFAIQNILESYKNFFPTFTDHSVLHSIDVANFCSNIIGDQIDKLNADEIYVLLMACYLHDSGMGISNKDYEAFRDELGYEKVSKADIPEQIRKKHNEFSGLFIKKYSYLFDIPSKEHIFAIVQISRGHRKTDLYDEKEYPSEYMMPNGNTVCLPYLSALIRLADEIDVASDRNISFLFDNLIANVTKEVDIIAFGMHKAIKSVSVSDDSYIMTVDTTNERAYKDVLEQNKKIQETIDYCCAVAAKRSKMTIKQNKITVITK